MTTMIAVAHIIITNFNFSLETVKGNSTMSTVC